MAIEGPIKELNLIDLFQVLSFNQKTGILFIDSTEKKAKVYFDKGAVAYVNHDDQNLGIDLIKSEIITKNVYDEILKTVSPNEETVAMEIIKRGIISEQRFRRFLKEKVENNIFLLFDWDEGYFKFEEGIFSLNELFKYKIKTESLIMEGSRRIDEWSRLSSKIPSTDLKPILSDDPDKIEVINLNPKEWEILSMINGDNSIKDIAAKYGNEFQIAKLIYGMMTLGIVHVNQREEHEKEKDYLSRGKQYYDDGFYDKSVEELKIYLKVNQNDINAYIIICSAFYAMHQFEKINGYAELAIKNEIMDYHICKFNAIAYYRRGNITKAANEWERVIALTSDENLKTKIQNLINLLNKSEKLTNEFIGG